MTEHDNSFDLEVRSILEDAQEAVPDSVWENLTPRLDIMAEERRRQIFLRWTRRVTAVTSVAAAVAIAVLFPWGAELSVKEPENQAIAVAEPVQETRPEEKYIALAAAPEEKTAKRHAVEQSAVPQSVPSATAVTKQDNQDVTIPENPESQTAAVKSAETPEEKPVKEYSGGPEEAATATFEEFGEEAVGKDRPSVSIVMSGNATSNTRSKNSGAGPMRAPEKLQANSLYERESAYGIPLTFGLGARIEFNRHWSMSVGVNYTMLSRNFKGFYTDADGQPMPEASFVNTQGYIGIPVNVYFNILSGDFADFYAYAGGTVEKCVYNKFTARSTVTDIRNEKVGGVQCSANIGLGVEFILADWLGLYIDPSVRYYFKGNQPKSIRTQQPLQLGFELGFRLRL